MIQRYDMQCNMYGAFIGPKDNGEYVRYADIEPLKQKCEAYRSLCKEMAEVLYDLWQYDGGDEEQRDRGHALCQQFQKLQNLYVRHEEDPNA